MSQLKPLPAEKVIKVLTKIGFELRRQRGSHVILKNDEGIVVVVPVHPGEEIGRGLLMKIIRQAGLTKDEFLELLEEI
jgi:predicted RNA binding protein YcfA (HicA-like mRNA interferase family)